MAVNVVQSRNNAIISGDTTISADDGLSLTAETEKADSTGKAIAGYSSGNIGIGGAISVNVASAKTNAKIYGNGVDITLGGGDLEITANADTHFGTKGNAKGESAAAAGVGAGIAVSVTGSDAVAAVHDNVQFHLADEDAALDNIRVIATQKVADTIYAKAGGAGGVSVMPVLALNITGSSANAYLGALAGDILSAGSERDLYERRTEDSRGLCQQRGGAYLHGPRFRRRRHRRGRRVLQHRHY